MILRKFTHSETITVDVRQVGLNPFSTWKSFSDTRIRLGLSFKQFEKCIGCGDKFAGDDPIFIAIQENKGNRFVCLACRNRFYAEAMP